MIVNNKPESNLTVSVPRLVWWEWDLPLWPVQPNVPELSALERAQGMVEHLEKFAHGDPSQKAKGFSAYFFLDHPLHRELRHHFLNLIGVESTLSDTTTEMSFPIVEGLIHPAKIAEVVLRATCNKDDQGTPFDITYVGLLNDTRGSAS